MSQSSISPGYDSYMVALMLMAPMAMMSQSSISPGYDSYWFCLGKIPCGDCCKSQSSISPGYDSYRPLFSPLKNK